MAIPLGHLDLQSLQLPCVPVHTTPIIETHYMGEGNPTYTHEVKNPCPVDKGEHQQILPCSKTVNHYMGEKNPWYTHQTSHPCRIDDIPQTGHCGPCGSGGTGPGADQYQLHGSSIRHVNNLHGV